jgi:chemotaxis protein MotA
MNWVSIIGFLISLVIFCGSIFVETQKWQVFLNLHAFALVIGGSFASVFVSYRGRYVIKAFGFILRTLRKQKITPLTLKEDVKRFIEWSRVLSKSGLDGLAKATEGDLFMERCIYLAKQEYTEEEFNKMAGTLIENDYNRQHVFSDILVRMGEISPAFGMVGTLVGLIIMLQEVGADPTGIAKGIGLALIATLYGVVAAKIFYEPFAYKIREYLSIQLFRRQLLLEGFSMLIAQKNPLTIMDTLNCQLDPKFVYTRDDIAKSASDKKEEE